MVRKRRNKNTNKYNLVPNKYLSSNLNNKYYEKSNITKYEYLDRQNVVNIIYKYYSKDIKTFHRFCESENKIGHTASHRVCKYLRALYIIDERPLDECGHKIRVIQYFKSLYMVPDDIAPIWHYHNEHTRIHQLCESGKIQLVGAPFKKYFSNCHRVFEGTQDCNFCTDGICQCLHKIDDKYHKYDEKTGKYIHIKRLPDFKASITCEHLGKHIDQIESEIYYILDDKFYWRYKYIRGMGFVIKFYPNLDHEDHIDALLRVLRIRIKKRNKIIEQKIENGYRYNDIEYLFFLFYRLPLDMQNEIIGYLV